MTNVVLRPRSASEIVDAAFQIMRRHLLTLLALSIAVMLPVMGCLVLIAMNGFGDPARNVASSGSVVWAIMFGLAALACFFVAQNAVMAAASQAYLGQEISARAAIGRALARTIPFLLIMILAFAGMFAGFLLFIIPGVYLALRLIPLATVAVLEDGDPGQTLRRAWDLGRGHVGHMWVVSFIGGLMYFAVSIIGQVLTGVLGAMIPGTAAVGVSGILSIVTLALAYPFVQTIRVCLYYDLRIRHEGLDVEMMAQGLGGLAPEV